MKFFAPFFFSAVFCVGFAAPVLAQPQSQSPPSKLNVDQLFAGTCGFCHADGGRAAGKGPQLMGTKRSDDFIRHRIIYGKAGAMPAFGSMFTEADIDKIIHYIRTLKPD